jgi:hypothetical protein
MSRNSTSEFDVISLSSSRDDSSHPQSAENESSSVYDYYEYDSDYQEEEVESIASQEKDAVIDEYTSANRVEIIFPPFSDMLLSRAVANPKQELDASTMASSKFVPVDNSTYASNISASVGPERQIQNTANSMTTASSSWSHVDHSVSLGVQSIASTVMNDSVELSSKSLISAFELVTTADGSMRARCKACDCMNQNESGLCRGCDAVLVNNPCLEMDEALAMALQQKEARISLVQRKILASSRTSPFVRAQALAVEVTSMVLRRRRGWGDVNHDSSTTGTGTQPECFPCQPLQEMDLTFQASSFIERLEFSRSAGKGFRLAFGYAFSRKIAVAEICRDGLPERNCRRLIVSTDPEVAFRLKNGLTPLPSNEDEKVEEETKKNEEEPAADHDTNQSPPPADGPLSQYNQSSCVGWIVAVVTSLDARYDWSTLEHKLSEQEDPQKTEFLNTTPSKAVHCLPMAYFEAVHRKDARIALLFQGLSDVCVDYFHTDWSLIAIDEE